VGVNAQNEEDFIASKKTVVLNNGINKSYTLQQCFSTFFGSRHPVGLKKNLAAPLLG
jgi:hypothetical protein